MENDLPLAGMPGRSSGGRSALAVESLQKLGYANIAHLDGGLKAWTASRRNVNQG